MTNTFSSRLIKIRKEREISQNKLAKILSRPQQDISRWELGITEPRLNDIIALAIFFNVTTDYLLGLSSSDCRGWIKLNDND